MMSRAACCFCLCCLGSFLLLGGCSAGSSDVTPPTPADSHDDHGHDHGHSHGHGHDHESLGPNGGHVLAFGDEEFHAEWIHDDESGKLTVILLDKDAKQEITTSAESVTIEVKIGDSPSREYVLPALVGEAPDAGNSRFEVTKPPLITALKIGEGVEVTMHVELDGKPFSAKIEHHDHSHHGHHH